MVKSAWPMAVLIMSDFQGEATASEPEVVPLWKSTAEQRQFSSWASGFGGPDGQTKPSFGTFGGAEEPAADAPTPTDDEDIFDLAYRKGWEDGQAAHAQDQVMGELAATQLAGAISHLDDLYSTGSFEFILSAIEALFRRCSELAVPDGKLLQDWAMQLADLIDEDQKGAILVLHPEDIPLINAETCPIPMRADIAMLRGNLRLRHSGGWIEKGSEVVLDELQSLIDEFHAQRSQPDDG